MSEIISLPDGDIVDLHTSEGCRKCVAKHLKDTGASSRIFGCLAFLTEQLSAAESLLASVQAELHQTVEWTVIMTKRAEAAERERYYWKSLYQLFHTREDEVIKER